MPGYLVPDLKSGALHRQELLIKRSRFLVSLGHAPSPGAAKAFVEAIRKTFPDATHNCWAFVAGAPGDTGKAGYSDDGEPHGTAGRPMLTVLLHSGVGEIAAVVTRYFGGIKLGTGGLVRAYQDLVRLGLETLPTCEHMVTVRLHVAIDYPQVTLLRRMLPKYRASIDAEYFSTDATFEILLPQENVVEFSAEVANLTDGTAVILEE